MAPLPAGHDRLSALRHLGHWQEPGQYRGNRLSAHKPARTGLGLLQRMQTAPANRSKTGRSSSDPPSVMHHFHSHILRSPPARPNSPPAASIIRGSAESKAGRDSPARTTSSSSARSRTSRVKMAASRVTSSMHRPGRLTIRKCWFRRSGSLWFRTSRSTSTRKVCLGWRDSDPDLG